MSALPDHGWYCRSSRSLSSPASEQRVGGIKEKVLAARRAGIKTVILPERNKKDLFEDIPETLRKDMSFIFAKTVDGVLDAALQPMDAVKVKGKDKNGKNGHKKAKVDGASTGP